ncbi:Hypothetical predicted protein [Pelobates cultripes]|uniref:Uncharacterized protein n=1 Tax=Pelobates cultripes TaxID=61616 RepID=A0AAD1R8Q3_PELCU|nr:Hypothetical predicted protein [Pelobates cultripes]
MSLQSELTSYFHTNDTHDVSPETIWQAHKTVLRGLAISKAAYIKRTAQQEYNTLLKTLRDQTNEHLLKPTETGLNAITQTNKKLNEYLLAKTTSTLQRLHTHTYCQGNKAT